MVANNKTDGNEENSKGFLVLIAIMMITRLETILKVKKKSKIMDGNGITNIAIMSNTSAGIPRPE